MIKSHLFFVTNAPKSHRFQSVSILCRKICFSARLSTTLRLQWFNQPVFEKTFLQIFEHETANPLLVLWLKHASNYICKGPNKTQSSKKHPCKYSRSIPRCLSLCICFNSPPIFLPFGSGCTMEIPDSNGTTGIILCRPCQNIISHLFPPAKIGIIM